MGSGGNKNFPNAMVNVIIVRAAAPGHDPGSRMETDAIRGRFHKQGSTHTENFKLKFCALSSAQIQFKPTSGGGVTVDLKPRKSFFIHQCRFNCTPAMMADPSGCASREHCVEGLTPGSARPRTNHAFAH
jgi:hypothetical protein